MALKLNIPHTHIGVSFPEAYARVNSYVGDKDAISVQVATYATQQARQEDASAISLKTHDIPVSSLTGPLVAAIYAHLKNLPEFAGAIDC